MIWTRRIFHYVICASVLLLQTLYKNESARFTLYIVWIAIIRSRGRNLRAVRSACAIYTLLCFQVTVVFAATCSAVHAKNGSPFIFAKWFYNIVVFPCVKQYIPTLFINPWTFQVHNEKNKYLYLFSSLTIDYSSARLPLACSTSDAWAAPLLGFVCQW